MAIEVFNRHENKYIIDEKTYVRLQARLSDYMKPDSYNKRFETYQICNIYYDTPDSYLIRTSLMKPSYKEKLRIRSYGTPSTNSKVYVEIKKKFRGVVNKRRSALPLNEAYTFLESGKIPCANCGMNIQVLSEIAYMLEQHTLVPKVYLSYDRMAHFGTGQYDLRISFDTNIVTRRKDLFLESGIYGESLLPNGKWLMEIKTSGSIPIWLCRTLSEFRVYPVSFSKYGTEYKLSLVPGRESIKAYAFARRHPEYESQALALAQ
jgi:SPX domain protein involved in polyphosphate accumulation